MHQESAVVLLQVFPYFNADRENTDSLNTDPMNS